MKKAKKETNPVITALNKFIKLGKRAEKMLDKELAKDEARKIKIK